MSARTTGEMATLIAEHDWSATAVGPMHGWPQSLKTMLRMALSTGHPIFIFWGSDLTCFYNDAYRRSLGPEKHPAILGMSGRLAWPEIWEAISPQIELVMSGQGSTWYENQLVPIVRHGELQDVYWTYSYCPIDEPTAPHGVGGVLVITTETTAQVRAQEQLQLATDAGEIGFWDVDLVHDRLEWPDRVKAMFGISADRPVSMRDFYAGLHPEDHDRVQSAFEAALDPIRRALYDVEYRTVGKEDGIVRWVAAKGRAIFDAAGQARRVVGVAIDITRRKRDELQLRELNDKLEERVASALAERRLLADIVDGTDAYVQVADVNFRWLAINRASADEFERIFGVRPVVGASMLDALGGQPEHRAAVEAVWSRALTGEAFVATDAFGDPKRDRPYYEMRFSPLRDAQGQLIGAYQFVYDVTQRLRDQAKLAKAEHALNQAQKMDAVGRLTGGIAHDFNNLLQALRASFQLMHRSANDPKALARWIEHGAKVVERGTKLTEQLMSFSREQAPELGVLDVQGVLEDSRELLSRALGPRIRFDCDALDDNELTVIADRNQLEMTLLNIAINARDAMPNGGTFALRATASDGVAAGLEGADYVRLTLEDDGTGMTADVLARAFEPFYTTKERGKGTGLGLSQVYAMAHKAGGTVTIRSAPGQGTSIDLFLRRGGGSQEEEPKAPRSNDQLVAGPTLLLVDDDRDVLVVMAELLTEKGYDVVQASDGRSALEQLSKSAPDVMVVDYMMPGMTGVEVALEARIGHPQMPIVFASGYAETDELQAGELARSAVVRKPFDIEELHGAIQRLVQQRPSAGGTE